ncbi:MAG: D-alanyl-D-alanine carboxypeptidase family protein [Candidatus Paceibacterota bacterium]|jgi:LAS superfamily LD-carboxypeptidase LdcB
MNRRNWPVFFVSIGALLVIVILVGIGGYFYWQLRGDNLRLIEAKKSLESQLTALQNNLATTTLALQTEQAKTTAFASQLNGLAGTVGTLDKLSKTDKELLQKYSKVYFLNEHYLPSNFATITPVYLFNPKRSEQVHANIWPYLERLLVTASSSNVKLDVVSAYRSFAEQKSLKSKYLVSYGSGANKFSADQGYSEHQLGTTLDFSTATGVLSTSFDKTAQFAWLLANAYKYGFTLSYPKGNDYYQYEPWHWRFVGVALATKLHNEDKHFYDLSQRTIDQYLVNIFD